MADDLKGQRVLVTGGAGFIGSHLVDRLLRAGCRVRVLDALLPQVHPDGPPAYLNPAAEFRHADLRDTAALRSALEGIDVIAHLAAAVGVGQSMYEVSHYCAQNVMGTASLLETLIKEPSLRPRRILVASSMSIYGEGLYRCPQCGPQAPPPRPSAQLLTHAWEMRCPQCGAGTQALPTPETKPLLPTSIYAINKRDHEEMVLVVARSLAIPAVALRFFNVYGDRQTLGNPYTGVAAIFSSALLNGRAPLVFEDGLQARDFIHVSDLVEACMLALQRDDVEDDVFNVGTGKATNLVQLLELLRNEIPAGRGVEAHFVGRFREGDIRACYADIGRIQKRLGFVPRVALAQGVRELAEWARQQTCADRSQQALEELRRHNLVR